MTIKYELDLETFKAWSGAVSTLERIRDNNLCGQLENILEDLYPNGMTDTELNDLLWFDSDSIYEWLGLRTESEIQEDIDEIKSELEEIQEEIESLLTELDELEEDNDSERINDIFIELEELDSDKEYKEGELQECIEELENL